MTWISTVKCAHCDRKTYAVLSWSSLDRLAPKPLDGFDYECWGYCVHCERSVCPEHQATRRTTTTDARNLICTGCSDAERSVLGGLLILGQGLDDVAIVLASSAWSIEAHRVIFSAMWRLRARGEAIDLLTVKDELQRTGELDAVGGPAYISSLTDGVPRKCNIEYYARVVAGQET